MATRTDHSLPPHPRRSQRLSERDILRASVGGYSPARWEPPHTCQLSCLKPIGQDDNALCVICMDDVRDDEHTDVLLMQCGHWVCADAACRPKRNRKWNGSIGQYEHVALRCPRCSANLEPEAKTVLRVRKRVLRFPFCVARPTKPTNFYGHSPHDLSTGSGTGGPCDRAPRASPPPAPAAAMPPPPPPAPQPAA